MIDSSRDRNSKDTNSRETAERILQERARLLAIAPQEVTVQETIQVILFTMNNERFGIETKYVREVTQAGTITPIPSAPVFLCGVTNLRGEVLAVVDLFSFFDGKQRSASAELPIVVLGEQHVEFGLRVDEVEQVIQLKTDELLEPTGIASGGGRKFLKGVAGEAVLILDGDAVLADERLFVDQDE